MRRFFTLRKPYEGQFRYKFGHKGFENWVRFHPFTLYTTPLLVGYFFYGDLLEP